ncbi:MAG: flagellar protein export ATPase FliI [Bacillota bacterium]|nr:flagellar protein export ATPase FliI [Bacillota bacterium]
MDLTAKRMFEKYHRSLEEASTVRFIGRVSKIIGLTIESFGPQVKIGEVCHIYPLGNKEPIHAEVVGFSFEKVLLMPLGDMEGVGPGSKVYATGHLLSVKVGEALLGRVIDGVGDFLDDGPILDLKQRYPVNNEPPNPLKRMKIDRPISLGVRALDGLLTVGRGQRIGIFAGSGVGKSTLMGMIARNTQADVNVIALVGERGREVSEFIENDLGYEGLRRSVLVIATSDKPALVRVNAALVATSIAEFFRDKGLNVMLMMDSLTRFSMAQREIGLAVGEPPVARGYTPSVFTKLPALLERAGNSDKGSITGLYTVLVDGDDMNEPVADAIRGILDGHVVLSRALAHKGHYPAIDILQSVSRVMPNIVSGEHMKIARGFNEIFATYKGSEDLINMGAYEVGSNPKIDYAIRRIDELNAFLRQGVTEKSNLENITNLMLEATGR